MAAVDSAAEEMNAAPTAAAPELPPSGDAALPGRLGHRPGHPLADATVEHRRDDVVRGQLLGRDALGDRRRVGRTSRIGGTRDGSGGLFDVGSQRINLLIDIEHQLIGMADGRCSRAQKRINMTVHIFHQFLQIQNRLV